MRITLPSVVVLARFELSGPSLIRAQTELAQEVDWQEWINQIELHGLSGFANKHLQNHDLPIPNSVVRLLGDLKSRHIAATQMRYEILSEIDSVFGRENIDYVALKGAALMPAIYKEGYLRPMRDMDLLLPQNVIYKAAGCLRNLGFELPEAQLSKFMRDMHQLPNATKRLNGMIASVELHSDGISREVSGHFYYPKTASSVQNLAWNNLEFLALEDVRMLHQVTRHLEGLHSDALLKLINVMDVIGLAQHVNATGQWGRLESEYPHVINTLRCLHLLTPLPEDLHQPVGKLPTKPVANVGQIMGSLKSALFSDKGLAKFRSLLLPSDWWMHLHYNVDPTKSLLWVKLVRHPLRISNWLLRRAYSGFLGG